ncbi:Os01g0623550 [Oryza sativa Japonica Group]|uniref:Os01g0623550 protein n=1 Tax=Oryza sativa subsp. japonica TaxID=39947 RepID=A0A0N7KDC5_ORYSJ|nr:hypothetical protein EE612_004440 [Oryza sativa]BAS73233.1 Os01g0623550 [Oryza sativa Japonica Group]
MNSFFTLRDASFSLWLSRFPSMLSTSSMKMIAGASLAARLNKAWMHFSDSPYHFDVILAIEMFKKLAPAAFARALASIVFPVPGGPNSRTPLHGFKRPPLKKSGR